MDYLMWNEDCDTVWGLAGAFKDEFEFIETVIKAYKEFDNKYCEVSNVRIETCIYSPKEGLEADCLLPLSKTDIEISNYYVADVEEREE